jgi:hypothetical protein
MSPRARSALAAWVLLALLEANPDPLRAQLTCVPQAFGVPALSTPPPPRWWDADGDTVFPEIPNPTPAGAPPELQTLSDPRWRGAASHTDGSMSREVDFRALHFADSLYLSWQVPFAPGGLKTGTGGTAIDGDAVMFGIRESGGRLVMIRLLLNTTGDGDAKGPPAYQVRLDKFESSVWTMVSLAAQHWAKKFTRVWTKTSGTGDASWAFQMVIPTKSGGDLSKGVDISDPFDMWYTYFVFTPTGVQVQYHWPRTRVRDRDGDGILDGDITSDPSSLPDPASAADWGKFTIGPATAACVGDVALTAGNIGTDSPSGPSSEIKWADPGPGPTPLPTTPNTFVARPTNRGTATINLGTISADFYLANWGTLADWNDLGPTGNINTLWRKINGASAPTNGGDISPGTAGSANDIQFDWGSPAAPVTPCERYDYTPDPLGPPCSDLTARDYPTGLGCPGPRRACHQCLLVELSSGAPLTFLNKSVYRNMDFVTPHSPFKREAEVSVVGLPATSGATRDVYLYVETRNMPAWTNQSSADRDTFVVTHGRTILLDRGDTIRIPRTDTVVVGPAAITLGEGDTIRVPGQNTGKRRAVLQDAMDKGLLGADVIDSLMPTYRVHAYHATGDSVLVGGVKRPIVHAQTSFGYWVDHTKAVQGWRHRLEGAQLIQLAPNFYKIAVPNNGVATVTTTIEAVEPRPLALSLNAGVSIPHGTFSAAHDPGFGFTLDGKRQLNSTFAIVGLLGYHRFEGVGTNPDLDLYHASGGLEAALTSGPVAVVADAGGGVYHFSPGSTDPGAHAGIGLEFEVSLELELGVWYRAHTVFTSGSNTTFSSIQAGGRLRF